MNTTKQPRWDVVRTGRRDSTVLTIEERQSGVNGPWVEVWSTDEMSNDYAYSERSAMVAQLVATWPQRTAAARGYGLRLEPGDWPVVGPLARSERKGVANAAV